jgi:hypothetical protein
MGENYLNLVTLPTSQKCSISSVAKKNFFPFNQQFFPVMKLSLSGNSTAKEKR